jgi:hypothetical protein
MRIVAEGGAKRTGADKAGGVGAIFDGGVKSPSRLREGLGEGL